jgi:hypothetical protein
MRLSRLIVATLFFGLASATAQTPLSHGKQTEQVVVQFEKLVASGAFLTPEGWKMAGKLFASSSSFPRDGVISLMGTGASLGENWVRDDKAVVETNWTDYLGTIDSGLQFRPLDGPPTMTTFVFHLVYTNKHREIGTNRETIRESNGPWEWRIEEPQTVRWATVSRAIECVALMRDKTDNPLVSKNADKTIATLKRMAKPCGSASAC